VFAESSEQKQSKLEKKINSANSKLKDSRAVSNTLQKKVRTAEANLNTLSNQLHHTKQDVNKLTTKLLKSNALKTKLLVQTASQKHALAQQMQALYTSGKQSHLRLLLKQDDPSDISRTIKYYEYMNTHRLKRIKTIKKRLNKVKQVEDKINQDSLKLQQLQSRQSEKKQALKKAVKEKDRALRKQRKIVYSHEQKLARLKKEDARLKGVIQSLINKQKKEEKKRKQEKEKQSEKTSIKKDKVKKTKTKSKRTERHYVPNKSFSSLKGKLSWPVNGRIKHKFGSARNSKIKWKGVIISASGGTNVHTVARGKVEFSGRLKGYGYVIIIRHDKNYRSLYAYNRSIFKKAGDIVKTGEVIAAVGNSGRLEKPGLYFEISKGVARYNPAKWCH
jgi:septal ring factor EnvC (AmiA/AmiB activator)